MTQFDHAFRFSSQARSNRSAKGGRDEGVDADLLVVIGMAGTARAAQAQPAAPMAATGQGQPTIVLHVMNYAALSRGVLDETMARVARVYTVIGVRTVWVESGRSADQRQNGPLQSQILLLSRDTRT